MRAVAHAKINWALDITGEREDGYHLMDMLMQPITLTDTLHFEANDSDVISLSVKGNSDLPSDQTNLAYRAAKLLCEYTGQKHGVRIILDKSIPCGAGLGGGSSDAAAVLLALNRLWSLSLSPDVLDELALKLGADVPFFLHGNLCRVHGIGEDIQELSPGPRWHLVIIQPCEGLSTRDIFHGYNELNEIVHPDMDHLQLCLLSEDLSILPIHPGNVLESVSYQSHPEIGQAAGFLVRNHAVCAQMSGSGSAVFGVFENAKLAEAAAENARERWERVWVCQTCDEALHLHAL